MPRALGLLLAVTTLACGDGTLGTGRDAASSVDANAIDASAVDAGTIDATSPDTGMIDAGPFDGGEDGGPMPDAGPRPDGGPAVDGGNDSGPAPDAGATCAMAGAEATTFVASNKSCAVDSDCVIVSAPCYAAQEDCCVVYLSTSYARGVWSFLHNELDRCSPGGCACCGAIPAPPACVSGSCGPSR